MTGRGEGGEQAKSQPGVGMHSTAMRWRGEEGDSGERKTERMKERKDRNVNKWETNSQSIFCKLKEKRGGN